MIIYSYRIFNEGGILQHLYSASFFLRELLTKGIKKHTHTNQNVSISYGLLSQSTLTCFCLPFTTFSLVPYFIHHFNSINQHSKSSPESHRVSLLKLSKVPADGLSNTLSYCWYSKYLMTFHWPQSNRQGLEIESDLSQHQKLINTSSVTCLFGQRHNIQSAQVTLCYLIMTQSKIPTSQLSSNGSEQGKEFCSVGPYPEKSPITHAGQTECSVLRKRVCPS